MQEGSIGSSSLRRGGLEYLMGEKRYMSEMQESKVNFSNDLESFDGLSAIDGLGSLGNMSSDDDDDNLTDDKRAKFDDDEEVDGDADLKAQASLDRRRERNRVLARKTRQRKKVFYEALQRQVAQLVKENEILKGIVQTRKVEKRPPPVVPKVSNDLALLPPGVVHESATLLETADYRLVSAIQASQRSFCITNPALHDNPIVFASKGFLDLTGYRLDQVLGRNCRFLQGPGTDRRQVDALRKGIASGVDTSVCLLNYRADGTSFYNQVFLAPLRDKFQKIVNYVGVQVEVVVKLLETADSKKQSIRVKAEKKDFKDEEKDYVISLDPSVLEIVKAPTKDLNRHRPDQNQAEFNFDDYL